MIRFARAVATAALFLVAPAFAHDGVVHLGPINISAPFTRATLPNAPVGGGFLTIENTGSEPDTLVSVTSTVAKDAQIHEMAMQGEVMRMRKLDTGIAIPAGKTIELSPGGLHLMFLKVKEPFKQGGRVPATLTFQKAGKLEIVLPIEAAGPGGHQHN